MADGGLSEQLERHVVDDAAVVVERTAVPVARVLAHADVGDDVEVGIVRLDGADRLLHDAVLGIRPAAGFVLGLGQPEQDHRGDAERLELVDLGRQADRARSGTRRASMLTSSRSALPGLHEERVDEVARPQRVLAHHRTDALVGAKPARPVLGKLHVVVRLLLDELVDVDRLARRHRRASAARVWAGGRGHQRRCGSDLEVDQPLEQDDRVDRRLPPGRARRSAGRRSRRCCRTG